MKSGSFCADLDPDTKNKNEVTELELFSRRFDPLGQTVFSRCIGEKHLRFCEHKQLCRQIFLRQAKEECQNGDKETSFN